MNKLKGHTEHIHFMQPSSVLTDREAPEEGCLVGYGAIVHALGLPVPWPAKLFLISRKNRDHEQDGWVVKSYRYEPEDSLYGQLRFALKYEGIDLLILKKLFERSTEREIAELVTLVPNGVYSRRIWLLYEWLFDRELPLPDADTKLRYARLVDHRLQFGLREGERSKRHRLINDLPGTRDSCPMVRRTEKLEKELQEEPSAFEPESLKGISRELVRRASAFLLLEDSRASFSIEGESPKSQRAARWGEVIGQAGKKPLTKEELLKLQKLLIEDDRFIDMGFRHKGGFVGEHDPKTGEPLPEHIAARWQDLELLMDGWVEACDKLERDPLDPIIATSMLAFAFVFIHPFQDGNGRIHRYLIHHILARKGFSPKGFIFPVSAAILEHIEEYREVLIAHSHPLLRFIEWRSTSDHNVEVLNDTADYYRYFDATLQAEFLNDRVQETVHSIVPRELRYLERYDRFKRFIDERFEMPEGKLGTLLDFLEQNDGVLSKRARKKEFAGLSEEELSVIEAEYQRIFISSP